MDNFLKVHKESSITQSNRSYGKRKNKLRKSMVRENKACTYLGKAESALGETISE